jgi:dihydroorotase-like cyclic amidohydrolase
MKSPYVGSITDIQYLWDHISDIDCFVVGDFASQLKKAGVMNEINPYSYSFALLMTAVAEKRLTLDTIAKHCSENTRKIFGLADQVDSLIEVGNEV